MKKKTSEGTFDNEIKNLVILKEEVKAEATNDNRHSCPFMIVGSDHDTQESPAIKSTKRRPTTSKGRIQKSLESLGDPSFSLTI